MCGIAGWMGSSSGWDAESLRTGLARRGPDGSGVWRGPGATLVHTRLSIIDLSEAGAQPMRVAAAGRCSEHGGRKPETGPSATACPEEEAGRAGDGEPHPSSCVIVFNGEIYNYRELRTQLEEAGEEFAGHSDTEVLHRLLICEGETCLPRLAGMFAFCFRDESCGEALLARDAFGIKPLYYRIDGDTLAFASESRVLGQAADGADPEALRDFLLWGSVPEPATLNPMVRQLPAGHLLRWKDGEARIEQWHGTGRGKPEVGDPSEEGGEHRRKRGQKGSDIIDPPCAVSRTREALLESMRRHLIADVPVGIFLSGGIDSTAVLALAREVHGEGADIRTFSIGFDDPDFDESSIARRTAEHFGAWHTEWIMDPEEGAAEIPAFLEAVDQPSIDGFNTWCVSKLARREGMKVVLSGLGGDEFFAGYGSFHRVPRFRAAHRWLGPLRPVAARLLETRPAGSPWRRLAAFLRGGGSWLEAFHAQRGIFTPDEAATLAESLTGRMPAAPNWELGPIPRDGREVVSLMERSRYMRHQLLRDSDVFSMAHGLELRVPLVDVRLAEELLSVPARIRLRQGKQLLLEAVPEIPEWVKNQPKRGFRFPFQQWTESSFGNRLADARHKSPVELNAWYRTWAFAAALRALKRGDRGGAGCNDLRERCEA